MVKRYSRQGTSLYFAVQFLLYFSFLLLDLLGNNILVSNYLKYMIIIFCFLYIIFFGSSNHKVIKQCLFFGMLFTLISDYFLLLSDQFLYGIITFIIVQQIYAIRLTIKNELNLGNERCFLKAHLFRLIFNCFSTIGLCVFLSLLGVQLENIIILTIFYFISIIINVKMAIQVWFADRKNKNNLLFALGMVLFLLCDIHVGVYNISNFISIQEEWIYQFANIASILIWLFYAPSQVLIAYSAIGDNM